MANANEIDEKWTKMNKGSDWDDSLPQNGDDP